MGCRSDGNRFLFSVLFILMIIGGGTVSAQLAPVEDDAPALVSVEEQQQEMPQVTAVYGVTADDYLPAKKNIRLCSMCVRK
jgi:hypothetical protein